MHQPANAIRIRQGVDWVHLAHLTANHLHRPLRGGIICVLVDAYKPEPGTLNTDLLPTPEVLVDDLKDIVHKLTDWESRPLIGLRSLPSVRFARDSDLGPHVGPSSNGVLPLRIGSAIARIANGPK